MNKQELANTIETVLLPRVVNDDFDYGFRAGVLTAADWIRTHGND